MFGAKNLQQTKQFKQPLVVMVETFRRSAAKKSNIQKEKNLFNDTE